MTTPARLAEADRAAEAFQVALAAIGADTTVEALALWKRTSPTQSATAVTGWLRKAIQLVLFRRRQSRDLGLAYYRLVRALRTGRTVADPRKPEPQYVTLSTLRREFEALASGATVNAGTRSDDAGATTPGDTERPSERRTALSTEGGDDRILVEEIERLEELERQNDEAALEALNRALEALGPESRAKKYADIDPDTPVAEADELRREADEKAGARQAATAAREAMNGARGEIFTLSARDKKAVGYIRLSRTGTPCGWCAMLISRGPVYKSKQSAEYKDGDLYHDNCKCYAEPVFSFEQYEQSGRYALNREYAKLWPKVTRGLSGKAALSAWRRFIREQKKASQRDLESRVTPTDAQEATPA